MVKHIDAIHKKVKRYECDLCDFTSGRSEFLREHKARLHAGEFKFKCDHCAWKGMRSDKLKAHMKAFHPEVYQQMLLAKLADKPALCPICQKRFVDEKEVI